MIVAVSLEALLLPGDRSLASPLLTHAGLPGLESEGWMYFTMCLCFGMCIISFLLVAWCWKCLCRAHPAWGGNSQVQSCNCTWRHLDQKRQQCALWPRIRHTTFWCSSVSSLKFASAKGILDPLLLWKSIARMTCTSKSCDYVSPCLGKFNVLSSRDQTACWEIKHSASHESTWYFEPLFHNFTSVSQTAKGPWLLLELPGFLRAWKAIE